MKFSTLSLLSLAAISTPALACVQFSLNFNLDAQRINAALTDNGGQKCAITDQFFGIINNGYDTWVYLSCVGGYQAGIYLATGEVHYKYGSFDGTFGTTQTVIGHTTYWTANVWGC
ncbi:hypothetical protein V499_09796 [Pseudogymnoascus sp. VKM F-103]|uniref:Uncharacterized protein n=1 Tax=Pseudogymnoascus verrucosus TaxID=342668 RepID=A0A2P6FGT9_9PEZI|nr:uncharacterized protein VE01_10756 [Pseudogymnoascus verrucosus]KFY69744.1 hypothetical protein V499_09796 [Pseudogymnoascus sp. VKM F-103]PQM43860.1 hypothetical protein VE01_10756 [Pseudogymnoascus verrucosus]